MKIMDKILAIEILSRQRDSFLYDAEVSEREDFNAWSRGKAREFQTIIDWIEHLGKDDLNVDTID